MKKVFIFIVIVFIVSFNLINCTTQNDISIIRNDLQETAEKINIIFTDVKKDLKDLDRYTENLFENVDKYDTSIDKMYEKYDMFDDTILYKKRDDGGAAYFYSGIVKVTDKERRKVKLLENMEKQLIDFQKENSEYVVASYLNTWDTFNMIYPYFDVLTQYAPEIDVKDFNFYYEADEHYNPERKTVWVKDPYVDPAGNGWMISVISPIYNDDFLEGVLGADITMSTISKEFLANTGDRLMILNNDSLLISINKACTEVLNLNELKNHNYLEAIKADTFVPDDYKLSNNENSDIRKLVLKLKTKKEFEMVINNKQYTVICETIPELNWKIVQIID